MKNKKIVLIFTAAVFLILTISNAAHARAKWKGLWYLRGASECKEIEMNRKAKTVLGVYPKAIVEKEGEYYYLTVESMGKKYSYKMIEGKGPDFDLELISVGPNQPLAASGTVEGAYSAMFKKLVDCQASKLNTVEETPAK